VQRYLACSAHVHSHCAQSSARARVGYADAAAHGAVTGPSVLAVVHVNDEARVASKAQWLQLRTNTSACADALHSRTRRTAAQMHCSLACQHTAHLKTRSSRSCASSTTAHLSYNMQHDTWDTTHNCQPLSCRPMHSQRTTVRQGTWSALVAGQYGRLRATVWDGAFRCRHSSATSLNLSCGVIGSATISCGIVVLLWCILLQNSKHRDLHLSMISCGSAGSSRTVRQPAVRAAATYRGSPPVRYLAALRQPLPPLECSPLLVAAAVDSVPLGIDNRKRRVG
jgi:hypothetical protein